MASNAIKTNTIRWDRNRGRNTRDDPSSLSDEQTRESINVMLENVGLGTRRAGIGVGLQMINGTGTLADNIAALGFARLYVSAGTFTGFTSGMDRNATPRIIIGVNPLGGVAYTTVAPDAITSDPRFSDWLEHNGKLYFTCATAVNRLHEICAFQVLRSGLPAPAAPTTANTGAGAYAATLRYYRIQYHDDGAVGTTATGRIVYSNLGTAQSFTPSGAGTGVNVTRPALPAGESISHWVVFGSSDGVNFYNLSGLIVAATTVYFDNATPSTYFSGRTAAPVEGTFTPWPSVKYLANGASRMLGFGVHSPNTTSEGLSVITGRVYFTPAANTTDTHDDERISNTLQLKGWIDVGQRNQGRVDRGILDPIDDMNLVFQDVGIWGLLPTGNDAAPFRRVRLDPRKGSCGQRSQMIGEDEAGNPCAYFLDPIRGPYRYGSRGFEWIGYEVSEYCGNGRLVNQADYVHGIWDPIYRCCRWWVDVDEDNEPRTQIVFFPWQSGVYRRGDVRGGWTIHDGLAGQFVCSCVGVADGWGADNGENIAIGGLAEGIAPTVVACIDNSPNGYDNPSIDPLQGTAFTGSVESKAFAAPVPQIITQIGQCYLQAKASAGAQIEQGILRNFALALIASAQGVSRVSLNTTAAQTRVLKKFASLSGLVDQYAFSVLLQDPTLTSTLFQYDTPGTFALDVPEEGLLIVDCIGGGGGARSTLAAIAQAGGGGGSYAAFGPTYVQTGDTLSIVVGAGGAALNAAAGGTGGASSFSINGGLICNAPGGVGGQAGVGGTGGTGGTGTVTYDGGAGGSGGCGAPAIGAGGGGAAGYSGAGLIGANCGTGTGGAANAGVGGSPSGAGGNGGAANNPGNAGNNRGGGGGGNGSNGTGGAVGAGGLVRFRIFPAGWTLDRWLSSFENGSEV
jgi:hypothetical protein